MPTVTPGTGLLAVIPASEARARRQAARDEFVARHTAAMGYPPDPEALRRWYGR